MAVMEGSLSKWTNVMKGWQYRWFVLDDNAGLLSYYTSKEKMMRGVRRGCVRLKSAIIGIDDEDDSTFTITVDHKTFHFQARDGDERENWIRALEDTILRHNNRGHWDLRQQATSAVRDFDKRVSEADAYLQIMIEQTNNLEKRISSITDPEEKERCRLILDHANAMLDNIKHAIVLLQIAKNTAHPVNGIYHGPSASVTDVSGTTPQITGNLTIPGQSTVQPGIEVGSECTENRRQSNVLAMPTGAMTLLVPETSYSSSEGEDDFYDANDSPFTPNSLAATPTSGARVTFPDTESASAVPKLPTVPSAVTGTQCRAASIVSISSSNKVRLTEDGPLDYDALYEEDSETDVGSMETHGSVITHLLSQVKIGMDLTKVVLPTFILERRSLLEMYADYFAHPDCFLKIADLKDPKDRMVQVVRWYLSSYHAGRKSAVPKKPYNPVLGEVFRCHWDVSPGSNNESNSSTPVADGPVPWCTRNQLTFIAEQVSHHPPISAFYAEHYNKRISFCAHVWTKSKFLGLSIGVHNIGEGRVKVLDYDEEYILTFPNGYGRSILTVPWIELGGSVTVTCPKSGYHTDVEFLTKPFYGGKKHRITADIFGPGEKKKPILSLNGEWNSYMEGKWSDGAHENFFNVNEMQVNKKKVRKIAEQDSNESRKVWKEVTAGLTLNDIDRATRAKSEIEERQRELVLQRKQNNQDWETKEFKKNGEGWVYQSPLEVRIPKNIQTLDNAR